MAVDSQIVRSQFEVSEASFLQSGSQSYRPVDEVLTHVMVGHHHGFDHIAFKSGGDPQEWLEKTSALESALLPIEDLGEEWEDGAVVIRYESSLRGKLSEFVVDLIEKVDPDDVDQSVDSIIREWSKLWRRIEGPLSRELQRGLFGELIVLGKFIQANGPEAVAYWKGPLGGTHDFSFPSMHIEVKTAGYSEPVLKISSFNQLRPISPGLLLLMVQVREGAQLTLPEIVDRIRSQLDSQREHSGVFEELLEKAGYLDQHSSNYKIPYQDIRISSIRIDEETDVLHEDRLDRPIGGLLEAKWSLDPRTLHFEELDSGFWSL